MQAPGEFGYLEMLSFPWAQGEGNISGALCKIREMKPGSGGTLFYFTCKDCVVETARGGEKQAVKFCRIRLPLETMVFAPLLWIPKETRLDFIQTIDLFH